MMMMRRRECGRRHCARTVFKSVSSCHSMRRCGGTTRRSAGRGGNWGIMLFDAGRQGRKRKEWTRLSWLRPAAGKRYHDTAVVCVCVCVWVGGWL